MFHVSNELLFVDLESLSSELERLKVFLILIELNQG